MRGENVSFIFCNPNPDRILVGDCVIRAVSIALDQDWETSYIGIALKGLEMHDMPSSNDVWREYLKQQGFTCSLIPNTCPSCYTINDFCKDNAEGRYILGTGSHAVAVIDGNYYDIWDSGNEVPIYYFARS